MMDDLQFYILFDSAQSNQDDDSWVTLKRNVNETLFTSEKLSVS